MEGERNRSFSGAVRPGFCQGICWSYDSGRRLLARELKRAKVLVLLLDDTSCFWQPDMEQEERTAHDVLHHADVIIVQQRNLPSRELVSGDQQREDG